MIRFLRLDKTKGSGAPVSGRYAYLVCVDDIDYFPPTDDKGVRLLGDIVLKTDTTMMPVYLSNSSKEFSYDSTGDDDEKSYIVKFSGTHPGTELEALEFAKNKIEESYIILIPSCNKDEPWKLLGEMLNPLIFTSSHKSANTGSKFTFNFEQRIGSEYLYFLYGGVITAPSDPGTPNPPVPGSGFDPTKWARIDASNIDDHVQAWRDKLDIQVDMTELKEKSEDNWKDIDTGSASNFIIEYSDTRTRFRINSTNDVPKTLTEILFLAGTDRAVEFLLFNNTNLNVKIDSKNTAGLSKGFAALNTPFTILPKAYALLKYNPATDVIEAWKVNTPGFSYPTTGNNGDVLEKDSTSSNGAKWVDRFGGLTNAFLPVWNGLKFINSIIFQGSGKIGLGKTDPAEVLDVNGRVKGNSFVLGTNITSTVPYEIGRISGKLGYVDSDGFFREILISGQTFEHHIVGKISTSTGVTGTYNCDLKAYTRWILTLVGNTTIAFQNTPATDQTMTISMKVTGNFTFTPPSWLKLSSISDLYDGTKINRMVFEINNESGILSGWYSITKMDS